MVSNYSLPIVSQTLERLTIDSELMGKRSHLCGAKARRGRLEKQLRVTTDEVDGVGQMVGSY